MATLNRSAIVVKPKQAFLDWLHTVDPTSHSLALRELVGEPTIYLIPECDTDAEVDEALRELDRAYRTRVARSVLWRPTRRALLVLTALGAAGLLLTVGSVLAVAPVLAS